MDTAATHPIAASSRTRRSSAAAPGRKLVPMSVPLRDADHRFGRGNDSHSGDRGSDHIEDGLARGYQEAACHWQRGEPGVSSPCGGQGRCNGIPFRWLPVGLLTIKPRIVICLRPVRLAGFEPATRCLEGSCSIQLSYRRYASHCAGSRSRRGHTSAEYRVTREHPGAGWPRGQARREGGSRRANAGARA